MGKISANCLMNELINNMQHCKMGNLYNKADKADK